MHTLQFYRHLREPPGEHTYFRSLKEHSQKNCEELGCFCITKIRLPEIFLRKKV